MRKWVAIHWGKPIEYSGVKNKFNIEWDKK